MTKKEAFEKLAMYLDETEPIVGLELDSEVWSVVKMALIGEKYFEQIANDIMGAVMTRCEGSAKDAIISVLKKYFE
jgi:hypothetical protein